MNNQPVHKTVLINEVVEYLDPQPGKLYVDVTFGCGGHTKAILEKEPNCKVLAIDWDQSIIEKCSPALKEKYGDNFMVAWGNFADIYKILRKLKISKVDGILADFGTSQYQIHERAGFSFRKDTPLDMRMSKSHNYLTAEIVLEKYPEKKLVKIFSELGEEWYSKKIARLIVEKRKTEKIKTTGQLAKLVESVYSGYSKVHPATRVFQALRIYVNKELKNISMFLSAAIQLLNNDAPLLCISFHSLEDRIVKDFFRDHTDSLKIVTSKPITATDEEIAENPSSRSAKLRVSKRI